MLRGRRRSTLLLTLPLCTLPLFGALALGACGPKEAAAPAQGAAEIACPAPIGPIPRESCGEIAEEFGALSFTGALKLAGSNRDAELRIAAIRSAGALANALKERRVALCEAYDACKVTVVEHAEKDKLLSDLMSGLIKLWDARRFSTPDEVVRFRNEVAALHKRLDGGGGAPAATADAGAPVAAKSAAVQIAGDALAHLEGAGATFKTAPGAVTVVQTSDGAHEVLRTKTEEARLAGGHRYQVEVLGTYAPASAPLLSPGDVVTARLKYRATQAGELFVALRSIEDPDALDATTTWRVGAGEKGAREAELAASPAASGFYLAVGGRGVGMLDLDDIELVRRGTVIAAARAESASEPFVSTRCAAVSKQPLAGKQSLRCDTSAAGAAGHEAGASDAVTIGMPAAHLYIAVRSSTGERAVVRTLSLEGGRSVDASLPDPIDVTVGLVGPGTATIRSILIRDLAL